GRFKIVFSRLRVGTIVNNETLSTFKKQLSPVCNTCKVRDNVTHLLLHCKKFRRERSLMKIQVHKIRPQMTLYCSLLLTDQPNYKVSALLEYLQSTNLLSHL